MAQPQPKSSPLHELCSALPSLPMRLREVGRFVAANDYDATTRSMGRMASTALLKVRGSMNSLLDSSGCGK